MFWKLLSMYEGFPQALKVFELGLKFFIVNYDSDSFNTDNEESEVASIVCVTDRSFGEV